MVTLSLAPAPLRAAAITPLPAQREIERTISIPSFNASNTSALWDGDQSTIYGVDNWMTDHGLFQFSMRDIKGLLLPSARDASVITNDKHMHAKLDKTGYTYQDRSFGTGSVAGFADIDGANLTNWYNFNETGFLTTFNCFYNDSVDYDFSKVSPPESTISIWQFSGYTAEGDLGGYLSYAAWTRQDLFAWIPSWNNATRNIKVQIFTGANKTNDPWSFAQFQHIQCDIHLEARLFRVHINTTSKVVASSPIDRAEIAWPHFGDTVAAMVVSALGDLTFIDCWLKT